MTALRLALNESTVGNAFDLPEIMDLSVIAANDEPLANLTVALSQSSLTVSLADNQDAALLPKCNGAIHLTAAVTSALMKHFTEDHELIDQVFECEETGGLRKLPLEL